MTTEQASTNVTGSAEDRQARLADLRTKFNNVPMVSGGKSTLPMATADAVKIVGTVIDVVGTEKAFLLRDLREEDKAKMCAGFGIKVEEGLTAHQISLALASALRRAKEVEVEYNKVKVVLMNQPGEGTRPSQWCVFNS